MTSLAHEIDPVFEALYIAFVKTMEDKTKQVQTVLAEYPAAYRDAIFAKWTKSIQIKVGRPTEVVNEKPVWREGYTTASGPHWNELKNFLMLHGGKTADQVIRLDQASDNVLFNMGDPSREEKTKRTGLVVGYVQSGKTANYTALTAKAFDAGYQLVIVLTGIHNSLRRQTQIRMNNELGLVKSTEKRPTASLTGPIGQESIQPLTSEDLLSGDFKYSNLHSSILTSGKFLCVSKKNVSVLKNLIKWLGSNLSVSVLLIDDEADQASINTGGSTAIEVPEEEAQENDPDRDPTVINGLIRKLVKLCNGHRTYVGYTATPYANVFVDKTTIDFYYEADLYPSDFIISLPKPDGYMGPEEFFGSSFSGEDISSSNLADRVIKIVPNEDVDWLEELDMQKAKFSSLDEILPESLVSALKTFVLATAARWHFEGRQVASSFLVHTSHKQDKQFALSVAIEKQIMDFHQTWRYDGSKAKLSWSAEWDLFKAEMATPDYQFAFSDLETHLDVLLGAFSLPVLVLNFRSDHELDYEAEPDLTAIIVGGNKLSRGLTLEGLLVSYFVRKPKQPKADTLTQMGRFFGFRQHIVEITRVYTTAALIHDFREISLLEAALRRDLQRYAKSGKTPREFAPRVQKRLGLMPTAKMGAAQEFGITYSGDLVQTTSFAKEDKLHKNQSNLDETTRFISSLQGKGFVPETFSVGGEVTKVLWRGVSTDLILSFLDKFQVVSAARRFEPNNITTYIRDQNSPEATSSQGQIAEAELTKFNVALVGRSFQENLGSEDFGTGIKVGKLERSLDKGSDSSIGTLITPISKDFKRGDELIDFDESALSQAAQLLEMDEELGPGAAAREVRDPSTGLLLVYPISADSLGSTPGKSNSSTLGQAIDFNGTVVGLALVFPYSDVDMSGRKYWKQLDDEIGT
jgi:hypothetical protein